MNVLFLSAGRRVSLVRAFMGAKAIKAVPCPSGQDSKIFVADIDGLAPTMQLTNAVTIEPVGSKDYEKRLEEIITDHKIDLVIPTIDTELPVLARLRVKYARRGVRLLVSDLCFVKEMQDKWSAYQFFKRHNIDTPKTWLHTDTLMEGLEEFVSTMPSEEVFFIKPRYGSASKNAMAVDKIKLGSALFLFGSNTLVQEKLVGTEATVDVLYDLRGNLLTYVARKRLKTLGGEVIQSVTFRDDVFDPWLLRVLPILGRAGARGPITLQAFLTEDGPKVTEVNPRFGGGVPLMFEASHWAIPWIILDMCRGWGPYEQHKHFGEPGAYDTDLYLTRHFTETYLVPSRNHNGQLLGLKRV